jgi:hypothetical protein
LAGAVWDIATADHDTAGTTGKAIADAAIGGDPWDVALPGAYGSGTAGKILSDVLADTGTDGVVVASIAANAITAAAIADAAIDAATFAVDAKRQLGVIATGTAEGSGTVTAENSDIRLRFVCSVFTSGDIYTTITDLVTPAATRRVTPAATGKVGATAGWVLGAASNISLATLPASQTASTLVVPVQGLRVGDRIMGFYAVGQVEAAGNEVGFTLALRKMTAAAADVTDSAVAALDEVLFFADATLSASNTRVADVSEVVGADESFYFLVTATTDAATDIALQALVVEIL